MSPFHPRLLDALLLPCLGIIASCGPNADVVIYCALDQVHAEPLIERFEKETGLVVRAEFDIEANKTIGLVNRLRAESKATRCDVFWNNEIGHTVALAEEGVLASYDSPSAKDIPAIFRDEQFRWTGFAARARVFIVNTDLVSPEELANINGMWDLFDPKWAGKVGMARPLTGTTLTHMTALYSVLGEDKAREYVAMAKRLNEEGKLALTSGNATLMKQVKVGELAFGWTDTDDYNVARESGAPVACVYPDQEEGGIGTLLIPNSVAMLNNAPNEDAAKKLIDFILREETERTLAYARSAQIPVRRGVERPGHVRGDFAPMAVDFRIVGSDLPTRQEELKELFID
ncbi:MAG: extracellular solute-binding protein [Planctomycetota bacterium]|nr:extracellular solute-binding protein [Planctomycetota bacterium]